MYKHWTVLLALIALLIAPVAIAQEEHREFRGTVTAQTDTMLTVESIKNEVMYFEILGQSLLPETLSVGDTVIVHHNIEGGETEMFPIVEVRLADDVDLPEQPVVADVELDRNEVQVETPEVDVDLRADVDVAEVEVETREEYEPAARLPQTASPLAALMLTGLAALGGAATLRRRR